MTLSDLLPLEKWVKLEKEINKRSGLNACVFDKDGVRITDYTKWANRLCPFIKANKKGQGYICALAHQNAANQAKTIKDAVIIECDAGLVKIVVPIFIDDQFLGVAGGCGLLMQDGEVDAFLVSKTMGIDTEEIQKLAVDIGVISNERMAEIIKYIEEELNRIKHNYKKQPYVSSF